MCKHDRTEQYNLLDNWFPIRDSQWFLPIPITNTLQDVWLDKSNSAEALVFMIFNKKKSWKQLTEYFWHFELKKAAASAYVTPYYFLFSKGVCSVVVEPSCM